MMTPSQEVWVARWIHKNGGKATNLTGHALKVLEECVELCLAFGATEKQMKEVVREGVMKSGNKIVLPTDREEEIADTAICLFALAFQYGRDVRACIDDKIPILEGRKWSPDQDGVLRRPR